MAWKYSGPSTWTPAEDTQVRELVAVGKTGSAIAKAIGRSESSVYRRIEILAARAKTTKRPCMCCGKTFNSAGPHNRLCGSCRTQQFSPYAP